MADRVGVMRAGRLEQCAAPAELYDRPATPFVAEFVGSMNRLEAVAEGDGRVRVGHQVLPADGPAPEPGSKVTVLVRPEALVVNPDAAGEATVVLSIFRGATTRLKLLRTDGVELLGDIASHRAGDLGLGSRVSVALLERPVLLASAGSGPTASEVDPEVAAG